MLKISMTLTFVLFNRHYQTFDVYRVLVAQFDVLSLSLLNTVSLFAKAAQINGLNPFRFYLLPSLLSHWLFNFKTSAFFTN